MPLMNRKARKNEVSYSTEASIAKDTEQIMVLPHRDSTLSASEKNSDHLNQANCEAFSIDLLKRERFNKALRVLVPPVAGKSEEDLRFESELVERAIDNVGNKVSLEKLSNILNRILIKSTYETPQDIIRHLRGGGLEGTRTNSDYPEEMLAKLDRYKKKVLNDGIWNSKFDLYVEPLTR